MTVQRRTVAEWIAHWDAKAAIEDPVELNGYCIGGAAIHRELYRAAVIDPWIERLELQAHHNVLDVGCGSGLLLREIESRVSKAVGADASEALLRRYHGSARTYLCAAHELPFEGEQFDRIAMCSVSHYFPDVGYFRDVIQKLVGLLRAPGIILVGDMLLGAQPEKTPFLWYERHELVDVLEPLGLPFSIAAQPPAKRAINCRYDVLVYKD